MLHVVSTVTYFASNILHIGHAIGPIVNLGSRLVGYLRSPSYDNMNVHICRALDDNYMYLIIDKATNEAACVDPVNPANFQDILKQTKANLTTVLTTHHHWDHAGGNNQVKQMYPNIKIYGEEKVQGLTNPVKHNEIIKLGNLEIRCLQTPCHTSGHICYYVDAGDQKAVFTGDTLFLAGCGRFFEGTADQMHRNLNEILANLPDETNVYCGHEYTEKNLKFGLTVEPNNKHIIEKLQKIADKKKAGEQVCTVPGTIGEEKLTNVFMRVNEPTVQQHVSKVDPVEVMAALRKAKDAF